ncbi:nucleoside deaminase [Pseudorhodoplanes sp.]|uniref:nucleoside deaminase n=1 Tax=Pseudorhodoplanes sp. TaxID=1934341 RepID=UPI002B9BF296|nr:nucleoside deaminase [Pseudorhodoplanes sp.]HWV51962.1 nucleoside deaminase [Pseudorhodoplanes sp.]
MITETDLRHLRRCVELARQALEAGERPFASVLVGADGTVLAEDHNRANSTGDPTRHPEFALARWAAENMTPEERSSATVYTSGEHCPMCSAAHGQVGLGRIVYVTSAAQFTDLMAELGLPKRTVNPIPIQEVVPGIAVEGPVPGLDQEVRELQRRAFSIR